MSLLDRSQHKPPTAFSLRPVVRQSRRTYICGRIVQRGKRADDLCRFCRLSDSDTGRESARTFLSSASMNKTELPGVPGNRPWRKANENPRTFSQMLASKPFMNGLAACEPAAENISGFFDPYGIDLRSIVWLPRCCRAHLSAPTGQLSGTNTFFEKGFGYGYPEGGLFPSARPETDTEVNPMSRKDAILSMHKCS